MRRRIWGTSWSYYSSWCCQKRSAVGFLGLVMVMGACTSTSENVRPDFLIGVVDPQRILQETRKGQQLTDQLHAFTKSRQTLVELEQQELRQFENELMAQRSVLSSEARERKEEIFRAKMVAYQKKVADLNREVQEKQRELQGEFRLTVQSVVADIANQQNLGMVLEHGANSGTMFYRPNWDISSEVIKALDEMGDE